MVDRKTMKVEIKSKAGEKIPVLKATEVFRKMQDIVFNIGDHLHGNAPRVAGDIPEKIKQECELVFVDLQYHSFYAELQLSYQQTTLTDEESTGEKALEQTKQIVNIINENKSPKQALGKIIDNSTRLNKILEDLKPIWPDPISTYTVSVGLDGHQQQFKPERKVIIEELLKPEFNENEETINGRIYEIRVDQNRRVWIDTPKGKVTLVYPLDLESYIFEHVGKIVEITGDQVKPGEIRIESKNNLRLNNSIEIPSFKIERKEMKLKHPISANVNYENDRYIFTNDKLNLLVVSNTIQKGMRELSSELATLWHEYALADNSELSDDAIKFKKQLLLLLQGE